MSVLRDHYYRLASDLPDERIEAATALLKELVSVDKTEEWDYALNRLITGLTTTRQGARFGFSMALTETVRELIYKKDYDLNVETYLAKVLKASEVKASMKGKEERSVLFGRLFGLQILVNSQLLFDKSVANDDILISYANSLIDLSSSKSWLRETSIFTLCQFITLYLTQKDASTDKVIIQILQRINDNGLNMTTEGIAVYLSVPKSIRSILASQINNQKLNWKNGDPFSKGNLPLLAKALKDVDVVDPEESSDEPNALKKKNNKQKGSWSPRIPFVWDLIVSSFNSIDNLQENEDVEIESSSKKRKKSSKSSSKRRKTEINESDISLKEFWKVVVDETLFSEKSSHERKYWGFEIFIKFLTSVNSSDILCLFTPNFMRCLINQAAQSNRLLNKVSVKVLKIIVEISKRDFIKAPAILGCLIDKSIGGCWNFDLVTKSKVTDSLVGILGNQSDSKIMNESQIELFLKSTASILFKAFNNARETQEGEVDAVRKSNDNIQKWVLDKFLILFRNSRGFENINNKWLDDIFKFLIEISFFKTSKTSDVSVNIRKLSQDRLNTFLSDTMTLKRKDSSYSSYCLKHIRSLEKSDENVLVLEFDDELLDIKKECYDLLSGIKELSKLKTASENGKKDQLMCFDLLFSMVLIQLYMGDDETVTVLGELKACYESIFVGSEEDSKNVDASVVLTEVILSFISRKPALLKKLSIIVWESFLCSKNENGTVKITPECFTLLFDVLETKENKEGQKKLFDEDDEFEDDVEEDSEGHDGSDAEESENDSGEEDVEENDKDVDSKENVGEVDKETNLKLAEALGIPTASSGEVKFDDIDSFGEDEEESYESDSMDDEQMMAMDDQLSKIFKDRRDAISNISSGNKRKAEVLEARDQMIFFKNRILDLLDSFSKLNPNSHLNISMVKPVVTLIDLTLDKNLGVKAHKLLKTRISKTKLVQEDFEINFTTKEAQVKYKESLLDLIKWAQESASSKSSNQSHSLACSQTCIFIAKNLVNLDSSYMSKVIDIYSDSLKGWASDHKNKTQASLFFDFINWINSKRVNKDK